MIESGVLTENDRVQLIDGWIIEMPPIGPMHGASTILTDRVIERVLPPGWHLRAQLPITLDNGEPEPDIVVARRDVRDYLKHHPGPKDIALVVEVADSTLQFDRNEKATLYASAQIVEYWILNLIDRQLEVHREPRASKTGGDYRIREVVDAAGSVNLIIEGQQVAQLRVKDLLP
jgi:Uma2 family endonuclease